MTTLTELIERTVLDFILANLVATDENQQQLANLLELKIAEYEEEE